MKRSSIFFLSLLPVLLFFGSCDTEDDIPPVENEEEVITTVTLTFTPEGGGTPLAFSYRDPDGEGPQDAVADTMVLAANTTYQMAITVLNETEEPAENITEEINEEQEAHLFFFGWTGDIFADPTNGDINSNRDAVLYEDSDDNGFPLGLTTTWTTASSSATGTFRVVLKHQPDIKSATSGINDGESDIDTDPTSFPVVIQ